MSLPVIPAKDHFVQQNCIYEKLNRQYKIIWDDIKQK